MPYTVNGKNQMLNALGITHVSLNSAYPDDNGANELAGGSYARKAITFSAAASGARDSATQPIFDVPASTAFAFWTGWDALTGGACKCYGAIGGARLFYSLDAVANRVKAAAHGLSGGAKVVFLRAAPTGLVAGQIYYLVNVTADDFQLATTAGGAAIDFTGSDASGILSTISIETSGVAGGQYTMSDADLYL